MLCAPTCCMLQWTPKRTKANIKGWLNPNRHRRRHSVAAVSLYMCGADDDGAACVLMMLRVYERYRVTRVHGIGQVNDAGVATHQ